MMCQRHEIIVVHVVCEIMLFLEEMCTLRPGGDGSGWAASALLALSCFNAELWSLTQGDVRAVWLQQCRCPLPGATVILLWHLCVTFFLSQKLPGMVALKQHHTLGSVCKYMELKAYSFQKVTGFPFYRGTGIFMGHLQHFCQDPFS